MLEAPEAPYSESAWEHTLSKSLAKDSTLGPRGGDVGLDMDPTLYLITQAPSS